MARGGVRPPLGRRRPDRSRKCGPARGGEARRRRAGGVERGSPRFGTPRCRRRLAADARARRRGTRPRSRVPLDAQLGRADLHARDTRRGNARCHRPASKPTCSYAGTPTCSTTASFRAGFAWSIPGASACRTRDGAGRSGRCSDRMSSSGGSEYDVVEAVAAARALGAPRQDMLELLVDPKSSDEVTAYFESLRGS